MFKGGNAFGRLHIFYLLIRRRPIPTYGLVWDECVLLFTYKSISWRVFYETLFMFYLHEKEKRPC